MRLVDQWQLVEDDLPADWQDVRLTLRTEQPADLPRAAEVLGPLGAGHAGDALVFHVRRAGGAQGPEAARRLFRRLDESRVWSELAAGAVATAPAAAAEAPAPAGSATASWDEALAVLPSGWSDLLCELELSSSDHLDPAALQCAPVNPTRSRSGLALVFRCARRAGYGVSPDMARRCLARLDGVGIPGTVRVLRVLSDTDNVATQGPVWYVDGRVL